MTTGEKIQRLRTDLMLSQEQLAEKLGVSRQSVSKWEMDQAIPQADKLLLLSQLLGVSLDELMREDIPLKSAMAQASNDATSYHRHYFGTDGFRGEANVVLTSDQAYQDQLSEVRMQLRILDMVSSYLAETPEGVYKVIPTNIGITDTGLNNVIASYDNLVAERNRMVANSSESNPRVVSMNTQLEDSKKAIELSVDNLKKVYSIRENELRKTISSSQRSIANIPQQQAAKPHSRDGFEHITAQGEKSGAETVHPGHIGGAGISAALAANVSAPCGAGEEYGCAEGAQQIAGCDHRSEFQYTHDKTSP